MVKISFEQSHIILWFLWLTWKTPEKHFRFIFQKMHFIWDATRQTHKILRSKIRTQNGNNFMAVTAISAIFRFWPIKYNLNQRHVHRILIIDTFLFALAEFWNQIGNSLECCKSYVPGQMDSVLGHHTCAKYDRKSINELISFKQNWNWH